MTDKLVFIKTKKYLFIKRLLKNEKASHIQGENIHNISVLQRTCIQNKEHKEILHLNSENANNPIEKGQST